MDPSVIFLIRRLLVPPSHPPTLSSALTTSPLDSASAIALTREHERHGIHTTRDCGDPIMFMSKCSLVLTGPSLGLRIMSI